jgi:hypothetical protein
VEGKIHEGWKARIPISFISFGCNESMRGKIKFNVGPTKKLSSQSSYVRTEEKAHGPINFDVLPFLSFLSLHIFCPFIY